MLRLLFSVQEFLLSPLQSGIPNSRLRCCLFCVQEFLLSPLQFGIPNSRLRYFLIAKKQPLAFHFSTQDQVQYIQLVSFLLVLTIRVIG